MAEYIEREDLEIVLNSWSNFLKHEYGKDDNYTSGFDEAVKIVKNFKSADVSPVRHGRWERTADGAALCTACKRKTNPSQYGYAFCGLCGARMDGD